MITMSEDDWLRLSVTVNLNSYVPSVRPVTVVAALFLFVIVSPEGPDIFVQR